MENYSSWLLVIGINFVTYFIARFALISRGTLRRGIYLVGLTLYVFSYILAFFVLKFISFIIFIILSYSLVRSAVTIIIEWLENKLFPYRKQAIEKKAKELNVDPDDLREQMYINSFKSDDEIFNEAMAKFRNRSK